MENQKVKSGKQKTLIGKEPEKLMAKKVVIMSVSIETQTYKDKKTDKETSSDKIVFVCKHPDKHDGLKISKVMYMQDKKLKESGLWNKFDSDGSIPFNSALANLMRFYEVEAYEDLTGIEVATCIGEYGYLVIKAY